MHTVLTAP